MVSSEGKVRPADSFPSLEELNEDDEQVLRLTLCPLVSSADDLGKQFGPRSGPTNRRA